MDTNRKRARILVAEDDPTFGESLEKMLRLDGHQVVRVMDGAEAVQRLAADGLAIDLVLCDLLLPRRSGFEVVREAKELGLEIPILVMTGVYAQAREIAALRGLGVAGYIHKSVPLDQVLFRVNGVLFPEVHSQRRTPRVAVSVLVEYPCEEGRRWATTFNLSEGGVYVRTPDPPAGGDIVELVLALPTSREPVRVNAEVVHAATTESVEGTGYPAGFGARFLSPSPVATSSIRRLVERVLADERSGGVIVDDTAPATDLSPVLAQICS